jgi:TrpR-related protein YerC/YecD
MNTNQPYTQTMKRRFTEDSWRREPWFKGLIAAIRSCKTDEDTENFIRDIATLSEMQAMSERLEVARLLAKGLSYRQVAEQTGASTTTVTRVAKFIENGEGGYRKVLNTHRHHRMKIDKKPVEHQMSDIRSQEQSSDSSPLLKPSPAPVSPLQKYLDRR